MKFLKRFFCFILFLVILVVIAGAILVNLTPNQLGFGNKVIYNNMTLNDMGLGDTKILKIAKSARNILNPKEEKIVDITVDDTTESTKVDDLFANATVEKNEGTYDYTSLVTEQVVYDKVYHFTYDDTTLTYLFQQIVKSADVSDNEAISFIGDLDATVNEVSITKNEDVRTLRIVLGVSTESFKEDIESKLGPAKSFVTIADKVFVVSYFTITNNAGEIADSSTEANVLINDSDDAVSKAIFDALIENLGPNFKTEDPKKEMNDMIFDAFSLVVSNLGQLEFFTLDSNEEAINLAMDNTAIDDHKIYIRTYKQE